MDRDFYDVNNTLRVVQLHRHIYEFVLTGNETYHKVADAKIYYIESGDLPVQASQSAVNSSHLQSHGSSPRVYIDTSGNLCFDVTDVIGYNSLNDWQTSVQDKAAAEEPIKVYYSRSTPVISDISDSALGKALMKIDYFDENVDIEDTSSMDVDIAYNSFNTVQEVLDNLTIQNQTILRVWS